MSEPRPSPDDARDMPTWRWGKPVEPTPGSEEKPPLSSELGTRWGQPTEVFRVIGDYELREKIGTGGMGVVYKARQISLNRIVAFKTIAARRLTKEKAIARFDTEAKVVATLDHPGIVPVYEIGAEAGRLYFSMEYVDGASLQERLRPGPLTPRQAAQVVARLADAVQHAHERGILHRDIKPSNVLLNKSGSPRIIDFGLAIRLTDGSGLTTTNAVVGTPNYMAPERATADLDRVGVPSDIYSLGAVLYECLVGKPPFVASTPARTMELLVNAELVKPRTINPMLPKILNDICVRCLEKNPSARFRSAAELARALNEWLDGDDSRDVHEEPLAAQTGNRRARDWTNLLLLLSLAIVAGLLAHTAFRLKMAQNQVVELQNQLQQAQPADQRP